MSTRAATVAVTVIVPVYNQPAELAQCLAALEASAGPDSEIIVVDDGSTGDTVAADAPTSARVLRLADNAGPAAARNHGARHARGEILFFVDADVIVAPGAVQHVTRVLSGDPTIAAVFGSYDASPRSQSVVSQYRNLLHHFVHQEGNPEASTFWAGCGAVRRSAFEAVGGFDEAYERPSIEDVELGYRLRSAGSRIRLVAEAQVTHLKRWTFASWLASDLRDRAIPWARLVRQGRGLPSELNFTLASRAATALVGVGIAALAFSFLEPRLLLVAVAAALMAVALDAPLLAFLARQVSFPFAAAAAGLQILHRAAGLLGFALGLVTRPRRLPRATPAT